MHFFRHYKKSFDPLELEIMARVFEATWETLKAESPAQDLGQDQELRRSLGESIVALATVHGVSDQDTLQAQVLATLAVPAVRRRSA